MTAAEAILLPLSSKVAKHFHPKVGVIPAQIGNHLGVIVSVIMKGKEDISVLN